MRVRVTKAFKWAPDGNNVREVQVGEVLEGRGAQVALEQKAGVEESSSPAPVGVEVVDSGAPVVEVKATEPAPESPAAPAAHSRKKHR